MMANYFRISFGNEREANLLALKWNFWKADAMNCICKDPSVDTVRELIAEAQRSLGKCVCVDLSMGRVKGKRYVSSL